MTSPIRSPNEASKNGRVAERRRSGTSKLRIDGLVAIPTYNEESGLPGVIECLKMYFEPQNLLFIDDGSTDRTAEILRAAVVPHLRHPVNLGYREALVSAIQVALSVKAPYVVFFDADGQHRVEDLIRVIRAFDDGAYDLVIGSRFQSGGIHAWTPRMLGNKLFASLASLYAKTRVTDSTSGLKLISRRCLPLVQTMQAEDFHAELIVELARRGARICEVGITVRGRAGGVSMYHLTKAALYPAKTFLCLLVGLLGGRAVEHPVERRGSDPGMRSANDRHSGFGGN